MRWLTGGAGTDRSERGAVLPMVAVLTVAMVGMAALVIDVGALLDERRQLQNGADAAALGVAQLIASSCPDGPCVPATLRARPRGWPPATAAAAKRRSTRSPPTSPPSG